MNDNVVTIDSTQVDRMLDTLGDENLQKKILYNAVIAGGVKVVENATQNLKSSMGSSADSMAGGITVKGDKAYTTAKVSIMKDHRLKWFEKGTNDRVTKGRKITGIDESSSRYALKREGKGHYTGKIKPTYFFRRAAQNTTAIDEAMYRSIDNALRNLNIQ